MKHSLSVVVLDLVVILEQIVILGHVVKLLIVIELLILHLISILVLHVIIAWLRLFNRWLLFNLLGFLEQGGHNFLRFHILVEVVESVSDFLNLANLAHEQLIEGQCVLLNVRVRFLDIVEQSHFLLSEVDGLVDVLAVSADHQFFVFENLLD